MTQLLICKNCGNQFSGKFCNQCGEKVYSDHDKTLRHFFEEAFHFVTHFDSKFLKTVRLVFFKPGFVSTEISHGVRKKYFKPVSLFLIGVIIYLLFPVLRGMNIHISAHISQYELLGIHFPKNWALSAMASQNLSEKQFVELFENKSEKVSKLLLFIIIPLTGLLLKLLFYRKKKFYFDHFTLAAEINTFNLYFNFLLVPLVVNLVYRVASVWGGWDADYGDDVYTSILLALVMVWYVTVALKRFYTLGTLHAILKSLLFLIGHILIVYLLYRLILFCIVMLLIGW
jgi:hypothetical protein